MNHPSSWAHALLESLEAAVALVDTEGRILALNPAWEKFLRGNPFLDDVRVGDDYLGLCERMKASPDGHLSIVALGLVGVMTGHVPRLHLDYHYEIEGERHWFGAFAHHVSGGGEVAAVIHHAHISERARLEHRLRQGETLFKAITDNSLDLIAILDGKAQFLYQSPGFAKVLHYLHGEGTKEGMAALVHDEDAKTFQGLLAEARKKGLSSLGEYRLRKKDGTWVPMEGRAVAIEQAFEDKNSVLLVSRDITARKEAELEQARMEIQLRHGQKMEAVGQLAAGIAHEINTPTQFISDNVRFLQDAFTSISKVVGIIRPLATEEPTSPELAGALASAYADEDVEYLLGEVPRALGQSLEGLERIATIVKAMKVFSHPTSEQRSAVDVNQAMETTLIVAANEWKYVAEVEKDLDPELPKISGFPGELNQVLLNLIVNAAHAIADVVGSTGEKGVITAITRRVAGGIEVEIADTGTGMPPEVKARIFEPFFTTKVVGKGTGQGLSVVHSVMTRHGGTIEVQSEPGQGARFILRFPLSPN